MAVEIKTESVNGEGTNLSNKYDEEVFATQGNIVNTIIAFNEQIKSHYNDKETDKASNDTLQKSLQEIVKILNATTSVNETFVSGTSVKQEDFTSDTTENKIYNDSGLLNKINILANIISGNKDSAKNWNPDTVGNTVGSDNTTESVPVIGYTRGETSYTLSGDYASARHTSPKVNGLVDENKNNNTVLSERQTADMVEAASKDIIDYYNGQISVIKDFMTGLNSTDSFNYALLNCTEDFVNYLPMQVSGFTESKDGNPFIYKITLLNGQEVSVPLNNVDQKLYFSLDNKVINVNPLIEGEVPTQKINGSSEDNFGIAVSYNIDESGFIVDVFKNASWVMGAYTIPVENKSVRLSFEGVTDVTNGTSYSIFAGNVLYKDNVNLTWTTDGSKATALVTLPIGFGTNIALKEHGIIHLESNGVIVSSDRYTILSDGKISIRSVFDDTLIVSKSFIVKIDPVNGTNIITFNVFEGNTLSEFGNNPTYEGYTFVRWQDSNRNLMTSATKIFSNLDVSAVWKPVEYDISYVGVDGLENLNKTKFTIEDEFSLKNISKFGYNFSGWFTDENFEYPVSSVNVGTTGELTFYAKFEPCEYKISYVLNDGLLGVGSPVKYLYGEGTSLVDPTRSLYNFEGWFTNPNFDGSPVTSLSEEHYGNVILYAKWVSTVKWNISYELFGGVNNLSNKAEYSIQDFPLQLHSPSKEGYDFEGWYTDSEMGLSSKISVIDASNANNFKLYAKFVARADVDYKINYYILIDGQNYNLTKTETKKSTADVVVSLDSTRFMNWYDGYELVDNNIYEKVVNADGSTEFDIYYVPSEYKIDYKFGLFVGNTNDFLNEARIYSYGAKVIELPEIVPVDSSFNFEGWYEVLNNETYTNRKYRINSYEMGDKTFYAKWTRNAPSMSLFKVTHAESLDSIGKVEVNYNKIQTGTSLLYKTDGGWITVTTSNSVINYTGEIHFKYAEISNADGYVPESAETSFVIKRFVDKPSMNLFTVTKASNDISPDGSILLGSNAFGLEYSSSENKAWLKIHEGTSLTGLSASSAYYFRFAETDNAQASGETAISLGSKTIPDKPNINFIVTDASSHSATDGSVKFEYAEATDGRIIEYSINNGDTYQPLNKFTRTVEGLPAGTTIVARWKETASTLPSSTVSVTVGVKHYTFTFNYDDADKFNPSIKSENYVIDVVGGYNVARPDNPSRLGYSFVNWVDKVTGKNFSFESEFITKDTEAMAVWSPNSYDIHYVAGKFSGYYDDVNADFSSHLPKQYTYDEEISLVDFEGEASIENSKLGFQNWVDSEGNPIDKITAEMAHTTKGITVTAIWKDIEPPSSVKNTSVVVDYDATRNTSNRNLEIKWENPSDRDFDFVRAYVDSNPTPIEIKFGSDDERYGLYEEDGISLGKLVLNGLSVENSHTVVLKTVDWVGNEQTDGKAVVIPAYEIADIELKFSQVDTLKLSDLGNDDTAVENVVWSVDDLTFVDFKNTEITNINLSTTEQHITVSAVYENITYKRMFTLKNVEMSIIADEEVIASDGSAKLSVAVPEGFEPSAIEWSVDSDSSKYLSTSVDEVNKGFTVSGNHTYYDFGSNNNLKIVVTANVTISGYTHTLEKKLELKEIIPFSNGSSIKTSYENGVISVTDITTVDGKEATERLTYKWFKYRDNIIDDVPELIGNTTEGIFDISDYVDGNVSSFFVEVSGDVTGVTIRKGIVTFLKNDKSINGLITKSTEDESYLDEKVVKSGVTGNGAYIYIEPLISDVNMTTTVTMIDANEEKAFVELSFKADNTFTNVNIREFDGTPVEESIVRHDAYDIGSEGNFSINKEDGIYKPYRTIEYKLSSDTSDNWKTLESDGNTDSYPMDTKVLFRYASDENYNASSNPLELSVLVEKVTVSISHQDDDDLTEIIPGSEYVFNRGETVGIERLGGYGNYKKTGYTFVGLINNTGSLPEGYGDNYENLTVSDNVTINYTGSSINVSDKNAVLKNDMNLRAVFVPNEYTLTLNLNGAVINGTSASVIEGITISSDKKSASIKYIYGSAVKLGKKNNKNEYTFFDDSDMSLSIGKTNQEVQVVGWTYTPKDITGVITFDDTVHQDGYLYFNETKRENITLYALLLDNKAPEIIQNPVVYINPDDHKPHLTFGKSPSDDAKNYYLATGKISTKYDVGTENKEKELEGQLKLNNGELYILAYFTWKLVEYKAEGIKFTGVNSINFDEKGVFDTEIESNKDYYILVTDEKNLTCIDLKYNKSDTTLTFGKISLGSTQVGLVNPTKNLIGLESKRPDYLKADLQNSSLTGTGLYNSHRVNGDVASTGFVCYAETTCNYSKYNKKILVEEYEGYDTENPNTGTYTFFEKYEGIVNHVDPFHFVKDGDVTTTNGSVNSQLSGDITQCDIKIDFAEDIAEGANAIFDEINISIDNEMILDPPEKVSEGHIVNAKAKLEGDSSLGKCEIKASYVDVNSNNHEDSYIVNVEFASCDVVLSANDFGLEKITEVKPVVNQAGENYVRSMVNADGSEVTFTTISGVSNGIYTYYVTGIMNISGTEYLTTQKAMVHAYRLGKIEAEASRESLTVRYIVTFNGNGGTIEGGNYAVGYVDYTYGENGSVKYTPLVYPNDDNVHYYGYSFKHWSSEPNGNPFVDGNISSNIILYAVWDEGFHITKADGSVKQMFINVDDYKELKIAETVGVKFDTSSTYSWVSSDDEIASISAVSSDNANQSATIHANKVGTVDVNASRDNYNCDFKVNVIHLRFVDDVDSMTLSDTKEIHVEVDLPEGVEMNNIEWEVTGGDSILISELDADGKTLTLKGENEGILQDGSQKVTVKANIFGEVEISKEITVTEAVKKVTLHKNNTLAGNEIEVLDVNCNTKAVIPSVEYEGFVFGGWFTDTNFENSFDSDTPVTQDIDLYAKWIEGFGVENIDGHRSTASEEDFNIVLTFEGDSYNMDNIEFSDTDKLFRCEKLDDGKTVKVSTGIVAEHDDSYVLSVRIGYLKKDVVIEVKPKYIVEFNTLGGSDVPAQTVIWGETASAPVNPSYYGWDFAGWYSSTDMSDENLYTFTSSVTSKVVLYAKWQDTTAAGPVTNVTANVYEAGADGKRAVKLNWTNPSNDDLTYIKIDCKDNDGNIIVPTVNTIEGGLREEHIFASIPSDKDITFTLTTFDKVNNDSEPVSLVVRGIHITSDIPKVSIGSITCSLSDSTVQAEWSLNIESNPYASIDSNTGVLTGSNNAGKTVTVRALHDNVTYFKAIEIVSPFTLADNISPLAGESISEKLIVTKASDISGDVVTWSTPSPNIITIDSQINAGDYSEVDISASRIKTAYTGNAVIMASVASGANSYVATYVVPVKFQTVSKEIATENVVNSISNQYGSSNLLTITYTEGSPVSFASTVSGYDKFDYTICGKNSEGKEINAVYEVIVDITGNISISEPKIQPVCLVKFDKNTTDNVNSAVNGETIARVIEGNALSINLAPVATYKGYIFRGWYTEKECVNGYVFSDVVSTDMTLYAKWEESASINTDAYILNNGDSDLALEVSFKADYDGDRTIQWDSSNEELAQVLPTEGDDTEATVKANEIGETGEVVVSARIGGLVLTCNVKVVNISITGFDQMDSTGEVELKLNISDNYKEEPIEWTIQ